MLGLFRARAQPAPPPAVVEIVCEGVAHRVIIKRMARARRFTLRVRAATGETVLTMPVRGSLKAARAFAEAHAGWIGARVAARPCAIPLAVGSTIPFRGEPLAILAAAGLRKAAYLEGEASRVVLRVAGTPAEQHRRVAALLHAAARADLTAAVARHAATVDRPVRGLALKDTRSRWGSCSSRGALNFSWRLILAPPFVLDYLAAHEVAHLVHLDHSPAFWAVAERLAPRLAEAEAWLRAHGAGLHLVGAAPALSGAETPDRPVAGRP